MRITVLASSYPRFDGYGTAPSVQSISENMVRLGHDVIVLAPYDPAVCDSRRGHVTVHQFRCAPVESWHIMGHGRSLAGDNRLRLGASLLLPFFLLSGFWATLRAARRQRTELIHAHWVIPSGLVGAWIAAILRVPLGVSLHRSDIFVAQTGRLFGRVAGWVFKHAAVVTACSEHLRQAAIELGAAADKVHLVAWGAVPGRFHPEVLPLRRSDFDLGSGNLMLVSLGRIVPKIGGLVNTIAGLLADGSQRTRLGEAARTSVHERLNCTNVTRRFAALFVGVV